MDYEGHAARHRYAQQKAYYAHPNLDPTHQGVEHVEPLNDAYLAHLANSIPLPSQADRDQVNLPPQQGDTNGYQENNYRPPVWVEPSQLPGPTQVHGVVQGTVTSPGPAAFHIQPSAGAHRPTLPTHPSLQAPMHPWLQIMCGPLVNYYTVQQGVWYGAAMVVLANEGSDLSQTPALSLSFEPSKFAQSGSHSLLPPGRLPGQLIYTYHGPSGIFSFYRFLLAVPMQAYEMSVTYRLNDGAPLDFLVPAIGQNMRWAAHSCNGFSHGVDPDEFKGPGFESGYDPVWIDLLEKHDQFGYHCMVGGGDQIYCDTVTLEPELQPWINAKTAKEKFATPLTDEVKFAIDRYYFSHYCHLFRLGAYAQAASHIPAVYMLDDHDLIDGFGSYDDDTMRSPIFRHIGSRGYFFFLLFQIFCVDELDGTQPGFGHHPIRSMLIGGEGSYVPHPNHTLMTYLGPKVYLCALDCRAERKIEVMASEKTYKLVFEHLRQLPAEVEQLIVLLGVPIAYPRMSLVENMLGSKFNPLNALSSAGFGPAGFSNDFNKDAELLDDLNDHWCAKGHKSERNWLVLELQKLALHQKIRVTFLSGDVHCAAVGLLQTWGHHRKSKELQPPQDHRWMMNVITSAIVNTPPPQPAQLLVHTMASHKHRTLHHADTDEVMVAVFEVDTDGSSRRMKYVMGRRNYCSVTRNDATGDLLFDLRVEIKQGEGKTKSYPVIAPAPRW